MRLGYFATKGLPSAACVASACHTPCSPPSAENEVDLSDDIYAESEAKVVSGETELIKPAGVRQQTVWFALQDTNHFTLEENCAEMKLNEPDRSQEVKNV